MVPALGLGDQRRGLLQNDTSPPTIAMGMAGMVAATIRRDILGTMVVGKPIGHSLEATWVDHPTRDHPEEGRLGIRGGHHPLAVFMAVPMASP